MAAGPLSAPIEAGRTLGGRYRLLEPIAHGGMAEVWEGVDEVLTRPVAVKVLQAHLAADGVFLERFRREAVTAARLVHPGIVATFDTGIDDGTAFIVMELVRGPTLRQLMTERHHFEPWLAVAVTRQIADALTHAHQAGLVHRDIKPANVLLTDDEWGGLRVKVTDFGIAKAGTVGNDLTRTGTVLGTPKYLSPEQIRGGEPDARADLYSLGVVLYEMLAGEPPFVGATDMATALAHLNERAPRLSSKAQSIPPALERLVTDLMAKEPSRRVESASALRQRLDALGLAPPLDPARGDGRRRGSAARRSRDGIIVPLFSRIGSTSSTPSQNGHAAPVTKVVPEHNGPVGSAGPAFGPPRPPAFGRSGLHGQGRPRPAPPRSSDGPHTDPFGRKVAVNRQVPRLRTTTLVVFALAAAGLILAAILLSVPGKRGAGRAGGTSAPSIAGVTPFMVNGRPPDDPQGIPFAFDGNAATVWHTDVYHDATFDGLYPGLGLEIQLTGAAKLHHLVVTSPTTGWAAQAYVSATPVTSGQGLTAWGQPTATQSNINGSTTLDLGGRHAQYVLLWITNLGPGFQTQVAELSVN